MLATSRRCYRFWSGCWGIGVNVEAAAHRAVATPLRRKEYVLDRKRAEVAPFIGTNPVATDGVCVMACPTGAKHLRVGAAPVNLTLART